MRQMHDKLVSDIEDLKSRRETIKAKMAVAKTQEKVAGFTSGADKAENAIERSTAWRRRRTACSTPPTPWPSSPTEPVDDAETLAEKYSGAANSAAVDDELARLKAEMGL